jgi:hypothetical protein
VPYKKVSGLTEKPSFTAIIPSPAGTIDIKTFKQANNISSYETELSSKINKECTNPTKFSSSVGFKLLHSKAMEASVIQGVQGKRMILPKSNTNTNIDSMSLKTPTQPEIFKGPTKSSKGKVILRTAGPEATKKLLPIKPKQQIFIIQNEKPQALTADAELNFSIPARNQPAYTI